MAYHYNKGIFIPSNPDKCLGNKKPTYRSGWELKVMRSLDEHPAILAWSSEFHKIPYRNPMTGRQTVYVPDFLIVYTDIDGKRRAEVVEVKPSSQVMGRAKGKYDQMAAIVNDAKWAAAQAWCRRNGLGFRVLTEQDMFNHPRKPAARRGPNRKRPRPARRATGNRRPARRSR